MDQLGAIPQLQVMPPMASGTAIGSNLQIGDQVSGQILGAQDGQFALNINGQTIPAESLVPLSPGEVFQFEFQGLNEGTLSLRLLTVDRELSFVPFTVEDLTAELASLKLPVSDATVGLAKSMVEFGIPLTKENVTELLQTLEKTPDEATMQAASFLENAEIPLTNENLKTLASFFQSKPELGNYLTQLQSFVLAGGADGRLGQLLAMLPSLLGEYLLDPQNTRKKNLSRLEMLAGMAGLNEKDSAQELTSLLVGLKTQIEEKGDKKEDLDPLSTTLIKIGDLIQGEHLLNADNRPGSFIYFQVPLLFLEQKATAQVRIRCEKEPGGNRFVNPENTRVEFAVTTPHLGAVQCVLDVLNRDVVAQLFVEQGREELVEACGSLLKEAVAKLGYSLSSMTVTNEPYDFWPLPKVAFDNLENVSVSA